ncbi:MAG: arginine--tRNA ligase [Thermoplasmatales archaeon]|nr:arginine--tRNA ligase [Thermoplasmatales archaeon]MCW6170161.1 arginine--tRNA ligase [Thermoplasmatales archaeon]
MLIFEDYLQKISDELKNQFPDYRESDIGIDHTGHSDVTFRTFRITKESKMNPDIIRSKINNAFLNVPYIENIEFNGGYVNFMIKPSAMMSAVAEQILHGGRFPDTFQDPERVSIEHTSANPTGPIHIGRTRNSIIGDSLFRLLSRYGYRVTTQYFVNDSGRQVASLYLGYTKYDRSPNPTVNSLWKAYQEISKEIEVDPSAEKEVNDIMRRYENGDPELLSGIKNVSKVIIDGVMASLNKIDIKIDDFTWESDLVQNKDIEQVLDLLGDHVESEGSAKFITLDGKKVFLTRDDGTSLYFSRDIAYHLYKFQYYDWCITVLGENHKDYSKHILEVFKNILGYEQRIDFVFYSYVSLESGKMATRKGVGALLDDLIERARDEAYKIVKEKRPELSEEHLREIAEAVAVSAIRFHIVKLNANKQIVFRWSEALDFEGDTAPFIMYSYARSTSIIKKAQDVEGDISEYYDEIERGLIKKMYFYANVLKDAVANLKPETIANYLLDLTRSFNDFYTNCPVINSEKEVRSRRMLLIRSYREIVKDASEIVGIRVLDEM